MATEQELKKTNPLCIKSFKALLDEDFKDRKLQRKRNYQKQLSLKLQKIL